MAFDACINSKDLHVIYNHTTLTGVEWVHCLFFFPLFYAAVKDHLEPPLLKSSPLFTS